MIPDCLLPPVGGDVRVDIRHLVTLSLGPAMDMSDCVPAPNLDRALCPNSLAPTLGLQRREYWAEINPLLAKWKNVNETRCPMCARLIRVNMARHLRLVHSEYVCVDHNTLLVTSAQPQSLIATMRAAVEDWTTSHQKGA